MGGEVVGDRGFGLFRETLRVMAQLARLALVEVRLSPEPEVEILHGAWLREGMSDAEFEQSPNRAAMIQTARDAGEHNLRGAGGWAVCARRKSTALAIEAGEGSASILAWWEERLVEFERLGRDAACIEALGQGIVVLDTDGRIGSLSTRAEEMLSVDAERVSGERFSEVIAPLPVTRESEDVVRGTFAGTLPELGFQVEPIDGSGYLLKLWQHETRSALRSRRRQFLSALRHDVRSPLTSLRGLVGVLGDEPEMSGDDRARMVALLQAEVERMVTWVEDYLVLLGIRNESRPIQPVTVKAQTLLQLLEDAFREHAAERGIDFEIGACPDWVEVRIDPSLRLPFLKNLVGHFFRLGEAKARIEIQVGSAGALNIEGRGPGLYTNHSADPFGTISRSTASGKRTPGVGLGLYLVKKVADVHGWPVRCEQGEGGLKVVVDWAVSGKRQAI